MPLWSSSTLDELVGEEAELVPDMKDLTSTSFGYLIAFLLPGVFGVYAVSTWLPQIGVLLQPVLKADTTVGPSVVFLLISVGFGLWVSAVRFFVFEKGLCRKHHLPKNLFALLVTDGKLTSFKAVVDEHYRYHQFYGGCAIVVLILFFGWWRAHHWIWNCQLAYMALGLSLLELLLGRSAADAYIRFVERSCIIVTGSHNQKS